MNAGRTRSATARACDGERTVNVCSVVAATPGGASHFGFLNVATAIVMVAVAVALSLWQGLDLERDILVASLRAFLQLMAIGYVIDFIFGTESLALVLLMIAAMVLFAGFTSGRRLRGLPHNYLIATGAIGIASALTLVLMVVLGIISTEARYLIPIGGMVVGNSMNVASVTGVRLLEDSSSQRALIEAALALGAAPRQAVHPGAAALGAPGDGPRRSTTPRRWASSSCPEP